VLQRVDVTGVSYERLQSAMRGTELPELVVQHHGVDGAHFPAAFPFSWAVRDLIDRLLAATATATATGNVSPGDHSVSALYMTHPIWLKLVTRSKVTML
jgi:hypothetical protein